MAYMSGHEHDLQYIESPLGDGQHAVSYVVSGAGSDIRSEDFYDFQVGAAVAFCAGQGEGAPRPAGGSGRPPPTAGS